MKLTEKDKYCIMMANETRLETMMELHEKEIYTIEEVAQILKISQTTVRRKIKTGELKSRRLGRLHRVSGTELKRLISGSDNRSSEIKEAIKSTNKR